MKSQARDKNRDYLLSGANMAVMTSVSTAKNDKKILCTIKFILFYWILISRLSVFGIRRRQVNFLEVSEKGKGSLHKRGLTTQ